MSKTHKGTYRPRNPEKYRGDHTQIEFRSSWERIFMKWADLNESVKKWSSEEMCLPYFDPIQKKTRRYFPDFIIQVMDSDGLIQTHMVEVKPHAEVIGPDRNPKRKTKSWVYAVKMYVTNQAKWEAAREYCKKKGWEFRIVTEYELGLKKRPK